MATIQERMHAVLQAAHVYKERYTVMADVFTLLHQMMREGTITPTEAMERFFSQLNAGTISIEAAGVIEAEQTRYALTRKRNAYMREYQRKKRSAGAGTFRAPSDGGDANAMSLAEIEAAIARTGAGTFRAPSSDAAPSANPPSAEPGAFRAPSNEPEPSIAFNAELSVDDLL